MKAHHAHGRRYGRPGGWQQAQQPDASDAAEWFAGRLPEDWFDGDPTVVVDINACGYHISDQGGQIADKIVGKIDSEKPEG